MNETIQTILKRRSIRAYEARQIAEDALQEILLAGQYAPTAMGQQPWHFTVVQNAEILEKLQVLCKNVFLTSDNEALRAVAAREGYHMFYHAPSLVIVSADCHAITPLQDCVLAMENMFLAAASLGIGSCWIHSVIQLYASAEGPSAFSSIGLTLPENHLPYAAGVFGYSVMPLPDAGPRKPGMVTRVR
ncbi:MAG: nitroreductase family protein [Chlorobiaceae bacterium]